MLGSIVGNQYLSINRTNFFKHINFLLLIMFTLFLTIFSTISIIDVIDAEQDLIF